MDKQKDTPYVVQDPEVLREFKRELLGTPAQRVKDVVQMLKDNPGKPVAIPKGYVYSGAFSDYNRLSEDDHVALRGVTRMNKGEQDVYYAILKEGRKRRYAQKNKRLEQARRLHPEDFPDPELVDEPA